MSVDNGDEFISYQEISARIAELEEGAEGFDVVRVRTDDVIMGGFEDEDAAREYIDREDYNPERVIVRRQELDEADKDELSELQALDERADGSFYSWRRDGKTLYRYDHFDADWARDEAAEWLGVSRDDTYRWPFDQVNWSDAAGSRRDEGYTEVTFGGVTYYGEDE